MREILFRGKMGQGRWVHWNEYGELVGIGGKKRTRYAYHRTINSISYYYTVQQLKDSNLLIKETVGQFTGLTDKNGKKVFEGDIVKDNKLNFRLLGDERKKHRSGIAVVKFGIHEVPSEDPFCWGTAYGFYFEGETIRPTPVQYKPYDEYCGEFEFEVIGNIHDNPELLESVK